MTAQHTHRQDLVPGVMRCAKCESQLYRTNLNMGAGTVTAGNSNTEPCPNGCGPLWPVTWQQYAGQMAESVERLAVERNDLKAANAELRAKNIELVRLPTQSEMAKLVAQECLDAYIDDAGNEQYSEEIDSVCWGEVKECATEKPTGEVINDYGDYVADYVLEAIAKAGVE